MYHPALDTASGGDLLKARFTRYLDRVLRHARIDYLRQRFRTLEQPTNAVGDDRADEKATRAFDEAHEAAIGPATLPSLASSEPLHAALESLNLRERSILVCLYVRELTLEETACILDMSVAALYKARSRTMTKLRNMIGGGSR